MPKPHIKNFKLIQYYLHVLKFSMGLADDALTTDLSNLAMSCMWEGQLWLAVEDGNLQFLFKNRATYIIAMDLKC
jgi:hypothetical protein